MVWAVSSLIIWCLKRSGPSAGWVSSYADKLKCWWNFQRKRWLCKKGFRTKAFTSIFVYGFLTKYICEFFRCRQKLNNRQKQFRELAGNNKSNMYKTIGLTWILTQAATVKLERRRSRTCSLLVTQKPSYVYTKRICNASSPGFIKVLSLTVATILLAIFYLYNIV